MMAQTCLLQLLLNSVNTLLGAGQALTDKWWRLYKYATTCQPSLDKKKASTSQAAEMQQKLMYHPSLSKEEPFTDQAAKRHITFHTHLHGNNITS